MVKTIVFGVVVQAGTIVRNEAMTLDPTDRIKQCVQDHIHPKYESSSLDWYSEMKSLPVDWNHISTDDGLIGEMECHGEEGRKMTILCNADDNVFKILGQCPKCEQVSHESGDEACRTKGGVFGPCQDEVGRGNCLVPRKQMDFEDNMNQDKFAQCVEDHKDQLSVDVDWDTISSVDGLEGQVNCNGGMGKMAIRCDAETKQFQILTHCRGCVKNAMTVKTNPSDGNCNFYTITCYHGYFLPARNGTMRSVYVFKLDGEKFTDETEQVDDVHCGQTMCVRKCRFEDLALKLKGMVDNYHISKMSVDGLSANYKVTKEDLTNENKKLWPFVELSGTCAHDADLEFSIKCQDGEIMIDRTCPDNDGTKHSKLRW